MVMLFCLRSFLINNFNEDWISGKRLLEIIELEVSIRKIRLEVGNFLFLRFFVRILIFSNVRCLFYGVGVNS